MCYKYIYIYIYIYNIVHKGVPAPLFKTPTPWPSLTPLFKIFVPRLLFSVPPPFEIS